MTDRTCSIEGCDRSVRARGWCQMHWARWYRCGDPGTAELRCNPRDEARTCSIPGCDRSVNARGWCESHYTRWRRHGDPLGGGPPSLHHLPEADRFWAKVDKRGPAECWEWTGKRLPRGYGLFAKPGSRRQTVYAHRTALVLHTGSPIPEGLVVCHSCDNPPCCNPRHLWVGTQAENVADMVAKGRTGVRPRPTHCPQGHPYDEANTKLKKDGRRGCRACEREQGRARRRRKKDQST